MSGGDFNVSELLASRESDQRASTAQRAGYLVRALVTVAVPLCTCGRGGCGTSATFFLVVVPRPCVRGRVMPAHGAV